MITFVCIQSSDVRAHIHTYIHTHLHTYLARLGMPARAAIVVLRSSCGQAADFPWQRQFESTLSLCHGRQQIRHTIRSSSLTILHNHTNMTEFEEHCAAAYKKERASSRRLARNTAL
ncbi:MAG: hypothetical protein ABI575_07440, partial [Oxalobacteraceae bacterium]